MGLNLVLWAGGLLLMAVGFIQARGPYARYQALRATDENFRRYDDWRGGGRIDEKPGVTGADVMRQHLRAQVRQWLFVAGVGIALAVLGFLVR
ncbi:MAG: hypothetical protein H0V12_11765 [Chloroflexi bacterium]|nr:hypothetical protein [Chloroflexota bacterium]